MYNKEDVPTCAVLSLAQLSLLKYSSLVALGSVRFVIMLARDCKICNYACTCLCINLVSNLTWYQIMDKLTLPEPLSLDGKIADN